MSPDKCAVILQEACALISLGKVDAAGALIQASLPFEPVQMAGRQYTPREMTRVFVRDGFIDRYRGTKLVFPPALRLISRLLPAEFPYHRNWKMTEGHMAYWEVCPTIDHLQPVVHGGEDREHNWMSCSMLTNSIKSNWTLAQLGWDLLPPGDLQKWDGLLVWFIKRLEGDSELQRNAYFKRWYNAARDYSA